MKKNTIEAFAGMGCSAAALKVKVQLLLCGFG
jgi:hypothetical protein